MLTWNNVVNVFKFNFSRCSAIKRGLHIHCCCHDSQNEQKKGSKEGREVVETGTNTNMEERNAHGWCAQGPNAGPNSRAHFLRSCVTHAFVLCCFQGCWLMVDKQVWCLVYVHEFFFYKGFLFVTNKKKVKNYWREARASSKPLTYLKHTQRRKVLRKHEA